MTEVICFPFIFHYWQLPIKLTQKAFYEKSASREKMKKKNLKTLKEL